MKDLARAEKRGKDVKKLNGVLSMLIIQKELPPKNRNHRLMGNFQNCWECHIEPDWLLIYQKTNEEIILVRTRRFMRIFFKLPTSAPRFATSFANQLALRSIG